MIVNPIRDRVVVRPDPMETQTPTGLFVVRNWDEGYAVTGEVVAVGPGMISQKGHLIPTIVKVGNRVRFNKHGVLVKQKFDDEELYIMNESHIIGVIK